MTESKLGFRTALCEDIDMSAQPGDRRGYAEAYGINADGRVVTKEGKCLAFLNIWQHRVSPCWLTLQSLVIARLSVYSS